MVWATSRTIVSKESSVPKLLPQKTQIRRFIAHAVGQLSITRLPKADACPAIIASNTARLRPTTA
jgi:hypothetical protein